MIEMNSKLISAVVAGLALATLCCSEAPLLERQANRVVLVELFSQTG